MNQTPFVKNVISMVLICDFCKFNSLGLGDDFEVHCMLRTFHLWVISKCPWLSLSYSVLKKIGLSWQTWCNPGICAVSVASDPWQCGRRSLMRLPCDVNVYGRFDFSLAMCNSSDIILRAHRQSRVNILRTCVRMNMDCMWQLKI